MAEQTGANVKGRVPLGSTCPDLRPCPNPSGTVRGCPRNAPRTKAKPRTRGGLLGVSLHRYLHPRAHKSTKLGLYFLETNLEPREAVAAD